MLRALKSLFGRRDPAQLVLELDAGQLRTCRRAARAAPRRSDSSASTTCRLTRNANVMVSCRGAELRVHEGYLSAPPEIHEAIVAFVESRTRAERRAATRESSRSPARPGATRPPRADASRG